MRNISKFLEADAEPFSAVLSNPPYQIQQVANQTGSYASYHLFLNVAEKISERISMVYPFRWIFTGHGNGLIEFRDKELRSSHYSEFIVESGESDVFEDVIIKGGVNYFLWEKNNEKLLEYCFNGISETRTTLLNNQKTMIPNPQHCGIIRKINVKQSVPVFTRNFYGDKASITKVNIDKVKDENGELRLFYSGKGGGVYSVLVSRDITTKPVDDYKVIASKTADPSQGTLRRINRLFIGEPNDILGTSFIKIGSFKTRMEAENCLFYLKTDLATFLFGTICMTQNAPRSIYSLIPDVDFSTGRIYDKPDCVLDFNNVEKLDEQLTEFYGLDENDLKLIQDSIRAWKGKTSVAADGA